MRKYTEADDQMLRDLVETHTHLQIAERMGWPTEMSVRKRCSRIGLVRKVAMVWTPEMDAVLRERRQSEVSFNDIAMEIGVTRNAAIGRACRIGLPKTGRTDRTNYRPKRGRALNTTQKINRARTQAKTGQPKFKVEKIPELPISAYFRGVTLLDLEPGQCRYPQGDAPTILFCGQASVPETSWCEHCSEIVYSNKRQLQISVAERYRRLRQGKRNYKQQQMRAA
jgi:GcrA cell cycle regulator